MKITLTPEESEHYFYNALCNGLDYIGDYGLVLNFSREEYLKATKQLETPCREDVLMQMLRNGNTLTLLDVEDVDTEPSNITIQDIHERVQNTPLCHLNDMFQEQDDANTADAILQTVFFSKIIYC